MILSKIFYALLTLVLLIFSIAYTGTLPVVLLLTLYIVAAGTAVWSLFARKKMRVTLYVEESDDEGNVPYRIHVDNASFFPVTFCEATLCCVNRFDEQSARQRVRFTIPPRGIQEMSGVLHTETAGAYEIVCDKIFFTDWFKLFRRKIKAPEPVYFHIWPRCHAIQAQLVTIPKEDITSSHYSPDKAGAVPGDFFGVRDYREGDRLQYVHWKLTGKTGAIVVKEFSLPRKNAITLLMEFSGAVDKTIKNAMLDAATTLSGFFLEGQVEHELCFLRDGHILRYEIPTRTSLYEALKDLLSQPPETGEEQPALSALQASAHRHLICVAGDKTAADNPVLHSQAVPAVLLLVAREGEPVFADNLRIVPVDAAHVQKSLMRLEL